MSLCTFNHSSLDNGWHSRLDNPELIPANYVHFSQQQSLFWLIRRYCQKKKSITTKVHNRYWLFLVSCMEIQTVKQEERAGRNSAGLSPLHRSGTSRSSYTGLAHTGLPLASFLVTLTTLGQRPGYFYPFPSNPMMKMGSGSTGSGIKIYLDSIMSTP